VTSNIQLFHLTLKLWSFVRLSNSENK